MRRHLLIHADPAAKARPSMAGLFILALTTSFAAPAFAQEDIDKVNGSIVAEAGRTYGELDTVNGGIRVERGAVAESAETVNGGITLEEDARIETVETVNGGIKLGAGAAVAGNASTVNGGVRLDEGGRIGGRVSTVNGMIELERAQIERGITTVNGDITIGEGSTVRGGIHVEKPSGWFNWGKQRKPRIVIGPNATVEGELRFEREVELYVSESAKVGKITGATAKRFSGATP